MSKNKKFIYQKSTVTLSQKQIRYLRERIFVGRNVLFSKLFDRWMR